MLPCAWFRIFGCILVARELFSMSLIGVRFTFGVLVFTLCAPPPQMFVHRDLARPLSFRAATTRTQACSVTQHLSLLGHNRKSGGVGCRLCERDCIVSDVCRLNGKIHAFSVLVGPLAADRGVWADHFPFKRDCGDRSSILGNVLKNGKLKTNFFSYIENKKTPNDSNKRVFYFIFCFGKGI